MRKTGRRPDNQYRVQRLEKLARLKALGIDPYPYGFAVSATAAELNARYKDLPAGTETRTRSRWRAASAPSATAACSSICTIRPAKFRSSTTRTSSRRRGQEILPLLDLGDIVGVYGPGPAHAARRADRQRRRDRRPGQGAVAAAGEIPRPHRYRDPLPPALSRFDHERGQPRDAAPPLAHHRGDAHAC